MYVEGARLGAPQAIQVADRWHLLKNLGEALEYFCLHHKHALKATADYLNGVEQDAAAQLRRPPTLDGAATMARNEAAGHERHTRAVERYHAVHALHAKHIDVANIARQLGVSRRTTYRYLRMTQPPPRMQIHIGRAHVIEPHVPYLIQRWNDGCRNATQMWRELQAQGYSHAVRTVVRFVSQLRHDSGVAYKFRQVAAAPIYTSDRTTHRPLTALQAARLFTLPAAQRTNWQEAYLRHLCETNEVIARTFRQVQTFVAMVRDRNSADFDPWLDDVKLTGTAELRTFASGLQRDYAAVKVGLTLPYSNGQTEAQIQRLKLLKRAMVRRVTHRRIAPAGSLEQEGSLGAIGITLRRKTTGKAALQKRGDDLQVVRVVLR